MTPLNTPTLVNPTSLEEREGGGIIVYYAKYSACTLSSNGVLGAPQS